MESGGVWRLCGLGVLPVPKKMSSSNSKAATDNRANQLNPNNAAYASSRSGAPAPRDTSHLDKAALDNRANQLNPNHSSFHSSRGGGGGGGGGRGKGGA